MTKRKQKKTDVPTTPTAAVAAPSVQPDGLRRVTVRLSEADANALQTANGQGVTVTAFASTAKGLTDAQRTSRKAYRLRPDVRAKQQAYRAARAKRIRAAKAAAKAAAVQPAQVEQSVP
jgi:aryl-alcohol dehydrogenase-like predicted oxidoreductase